VHEDGHALELNHNSCESSVLGRNLNGKPIPGWSADDLAEITVVQDARTKIQEYDIKIS
jgi:hypothetical protein